VVVTAEACRGTARETSAEAAMPQGSLTGGCGLSVDRWALVAEALCPPPRGDHLTAEPLTRLIQGQVEQLVCPGVQACDNAKRPARRPMLTRRSRRPRTPSRRRR
jgi:hypothetical protein